MPPIMLRGVKSLVPRTASTLVAAPRTILRLPLVTPDVFLSSLAMRTTRSIHRCRRMVFFVFRLLIFPLVIPNTPILSESSDVGHSKEDLVFFTCLS